MSDVFGAIAVISLFMLILYCMNQKLNILLEQQQDILYILKENNVWNI